MSFDLFYISPELILAAGGMIALIVGLFAKRLSPVVSLGALALALVPSVMLFTSPAKEQFGGMIAVDGFAVFFKIVALLSTAIVALLSLDYFRGIRVHRGEYYALLVFAALAITLLAASLNLVMIYLSLEFLSITSYILAGYVKQDPKSNEAAVKYFLYGSIAGAVMLYGMSILYGYTGSTGLFAIAEALRSGPTPGPLVFLATLFVLVGFGFKVAMVPFHQWAPDTYEGAPTPVTAFLSVGSKAAGFAVLVRVLAVGITWEAFNWAPLIIVLSGVTMTVGNLVAIPQRNIKRMLAYSSIAQAGYLLVGVAAMGVVPSGSGLQAVVLYLFAYLFMNLGAFAVVTALSGRLNTDDIRDYGGLVKTSPWLAVAMFFFLLSLA
ncbi:MAG: NADH-quinone oxidoreductase subunit N, partial [Armatimonadota bacterium]